MKMLLSTTALVVAFGFPYLTLAQTMQPVVAATMATTTAKGSAEVQGFLAKRGQSELFASELIGHDVYMNRAPSAETKTDGTQAKKTDEAATDGAQAKKTDETATDGAQAKATGGASDKTMMNRADLDNMDNIGQINEIVLSSDGQVLALVIGVGGFLGMGEHDVAVTMEQVKFSVDDADRSEMYIVVNTGAVNLKDAPAYDRSAEQADAATDKDETRAERTAFAAPAMEREGYERVEVKEVTTEMLQDKTVYDVNDQNVGTVTDTLIDDGGAITNIIIDFGGFLGIGSSQASIGYDELTILRTEGDADVRIYVDATKEQIQALPQYVAAN